MSSMLEKVTKNLLAAGGARLDLRVADIRPRGGMDVDFIIRYQPENGCPTRAEVTAFISQRFKGKFMPGAMADHGKISQRNGAVHMEATMPSAMHPMSYVEADPASWRALDQDKTQYMHMRTAEVWTVDRDSTGNPALFKKADDDLKALLRAARTDREKTAMSELTFEKLNVTAGAGVYDVGDVVTYYCRGTKCTGTIRNSERDAHGELRYHIEPEGGGQDAMDMIPHGMLVEMLEKSKASQAEMQNRLKQHYRKVYPSTPFSERLTRG